MRQHPLQMNPKRRASDLITIPTTVKIIRYFTRNFLFHFGHLSSKVKKKSFKPAILCEIRHYIWMQTGIRINSNICLVYKDRIVEELSNCSKKNVRYHVRGCSVHCWLNLEVIDPISKIWKSAKRCQL